MLGVRSKRELAACLGLSPPPSHDDKKDTDEPNPGPPAFSFNFLRACTSEEQESARFTRKELRVWLERIYISIVYPVWSERPPTQGYKNEVSPNTLSVFFSLLEHLRDTMHYPAHWLAEIVDSLYTKTAVELYEEDLECPRGTPTPKSKKVRMNLANARFDLLTHLLLYSDVFRTPLSQSLLDDGEKVLNDFSIRFDVDETHGVMLHRMGEDHRMMGMGVAAVPKSYLKTLNKMLSNTSSFFPGPPTRYHGTYAQYGIPTARGVCCAPNSHMFTSIRICPETSVAKGGLFGGEFSFTIKMDIALSALKELQKGTKKGEEYMFILLRTDSYVCVGFADVPEM